MAIAVRRDLGGMQMNKVETEPIVRKAELEVVHIESDYYYLSPGQVGDSPKERD